MINDSEMNASVKRRYNQRKITPAQLINQIDCCMILSFLLLTLAQKLDEEPGVKLFDRTGQPVMPNKIGSAMITRARHIPGEAGKFRQLKFRNYSTQALRATLRTH